MLNWRLENPVPPALPGNPTLIKQFADRYDRMSEALNQAVEELSNLANEGVSISLAVDEVRDRAQESISVTRKVAVRYEGASQTLNSYQASLDSAIDSAASARNTISSNNPNAGYWRRRERDLELQRLLDPTNNTIIEDLKEANRWVTEYDNDYLSAIQTYNSAVQARDNAVNAAIAGLDSAADRADLNDGFWESIEGAFDALYDLAQKYLAPVISIIRDVLEIIKQIVDVLAFIVTILAIFIPVLGPIAAALTVLSLALSVMIFLCSLVLFALGKESIGRVLGDLLDVAVGVLTTKFAPLKALPGAVTEIGTLGVKGLAQTGAMQFSLAFRMGAETALDSAKEIAMDEGKEWLKDTLIDFGVGQVQDFASDNRGETLSDYSSQGPAWSNAPFELDLNSAGEVGYDLANSATGGALDLPGNISENFSNSVSSGAELASNFNAISAVPAG